MHECISLFEQLSVHSQNTRPFEPKLRKKTSLSWFTIKKPAKKTHKTFDLNDKAAKINILLAKFMKFADHAPRIKMGRTIK